jgi:ubiquinone/menaquinone biosynthesis C-methylase UbiE
MASITAFAGSVPQNYETFLGPLFFEPYALDLVARMKQPCRQVLELACGTGRVTKQLLHKLAPDSRLHATDLNADMLKIAREQIIDDRIEWSVADAHSLPFADGQYELVICQYGVMFFGEKEKALAEVHRVLQKGGRFLFNTWDEVRFNAVSHLANEVLKEIFLEEPPNFFEKGPYSMYDPEKIRRLLGEAGFGDISIETVDKTSVAPSPDEPVKGILDGTPVSPFLKEHSEQADLVRQRLRDRLVQQFGEKNLQLPMRALVCEAVRL